MAIGGHYAIWIQFFVVYERVWYSQTQDFTNAERRNFFVVLLSKQKWAKIGKIRSEKCKTRNPTVPENRRADVRFRKKLGSLRWCFLYAGARAEQYWNDLCLFSQSPLDTKLAFLQSKVFKLHFLDTETLQPPKIWNCMSTEAIQIWRKGRYRSAMQYFW